MDPYILGLSRDHWSLIGILIQAIAAIGTVAAVIVSLWLAMRKPPSGINLSAFLEFSKSSTGTQPYSIVLEVANADRNRICIRGIGCSVWKYGWQWRRPWSLFRNDVAFLSPDVRFHGSPLGVSQLPHTMVQGDFVRFYAGMESPNLWMEIVRKLKKRPRKMEFYIELADGQVITTEAPHQCLGLVVTAHDMVYRNKTRSNQTSGR